MLASLLSVIAFQSLEPMTREITSFGSQAQIWLKVSNPYTTSARFVIDVTDGDRAPLPTATVSHRRLLLPGEGWRMIRVRVPKEGFPSRNFTVCVTTDAPVTNGAAVIGRVCGSYHASFRQLPSDY